MRRIQSFLAGALASFLLCFSLSVFAEDWNKPSLTSNYADVIADLKSRDVSAAKMDFSGATNIPTGVIRWNDSSQRFEKWNGSSWAELWPAVTTHLAATNNPHATTAAQVGAPTTADFLSHTSNTSNPHSTTAAQVGALAKASNLSDLTNAGTARSNLSAPSIADLLAHTGNTSNPHATTPAQIGALKASNNFSDIGNATTARANIGAAKSGVNADITSLQSAGSVSNSGDLYLATTSPANIIVWASSGGSTYWVFSPDGKINPPSSLRPDYTPWPIGLGGYSTIRSLNPAVATAADCANAINTIYADLIAQGEFQ